MDCLLLFVYFHFSFTILGQLLQVIVSSLHNILPTSYTRYIDETIDLIETEVVDHTKYSPYGRWDSYLKFLKGIKNGIANPDKNNQSRKEFISNLDKLTSRRNLNFAETFPEMVEFYNECKQL